MQDDVDKLIDGGLSEYCCAAEPLAGLEQRILSGVRAAETARRRRWLWEPVIITATAAVALMLVERKSQPVPVAHVAIPPASAPAGPPTILIPNVSQPGRPRIARARHAPAPRQLPKRKLFPTVTPLAAEERLLMLLAQRHPEELLIRPRGEIELKPIQIEPLQIDGGQ